MATTLLLVRHGETEWNRERRFQGHADTPLNDAGRAQAHELAASLAHDPVAAVYTSPLARAYETAQILAARIGLEPRLDARLMEIDVGSWTGLTIDELERRFPVELDRWRTGTTGRSWSDGETYDELARRVLQALHEIGTRHPDGTVVVVGHGGTLRVTLAHAAGVSVHEHRLAGPSPTNCSVHRVLLDRGHLRVD